jgi:hypothetical protein
MTLLGIHRSAPQVADLFTVPFYFAGGWKLSGSLSGSGRQKERSSDRGEVNFDYLSLKTSVRYVEIEGARCATMLSRRARQTNSSRPLVVTTKLRVITTMHSIDQCLVID